MLKRVSTALKFMTYGVLVGILFAPESGASTRRRIMNWVRSGVRDITGNITGGSRQQ